MMGISAGKNRTNILKEKFAKKDGGKLPWLLWYNKKPPKYQAVGTSSVHTDPVPGSRI